MGCLQTLIIDNIADDEDDNSVDFCKFVIKNTEFLQKLSRIQINAKFCEIKVMPILEALSAILLNSAEQKIKINFFNSVYSNAIKWIKAQMVQKLKNGEIICYDIWSVQFSCDKSYDLSMVNTNQI